ncbi:hypothetical protein D3C71_844390 [compost metagenome]
MRQSDLFIPQKRPWNAGRLIGPKVPLKPKHIWAIRQQLKVAKRDRDLAMFNCALDSKLRACDLVAGFINGQRTGLLQVTAHNGGVDLVYLGPDDLNAQLL